jgi:hypothetical protein
VFPTATVVLAIPKLRAIPRESLFEQIVCVVIIGISLLVWSAGCLLVPRESDIESTKAYLILCNMASPPEESWADLPQDVLQVLHKAA